ncbi:Hermansky-Pudlak syndrome 5 protein homolog [Anopheles arabiensis]|uniref:Hermansky-Pudlak syndrome 5 protein homolog n=1 Tax=Anopheles arabiensis TaxID=7173 RepID=A0A182HU43_ANOAR|nr:Hermansky-Pudlak syndrome 5 protein homolog [Anopheles arabiensis]
MDATNKQYALRDRAELSAFVNQPFRNNSRIKFTCFDCSPKYFVFGANSGSLYLYDRITTSFLAIFPSQLGTIGKVSISHNEKQIAIGNQTGSIGVLLELEPPHVKEILSTELAPSTDGEGQPIDLGGPAFVTSFCWTEDDRELYCGDSRGIVSLIQFSLFMGRNILNISLHPVLLLENRIVQIDRYKDLLLVSTLSKCVLCNTAREEFKQIGNRPRDGQYGASFVIAHPNTNASAATTTTPSPPLMIVDEEDVRIFCSRPGSRLWEADLEGNVIRTHQFKQAAAAAAAVAASRRRRSHQQQQQQLQCLQESELATAPTEAPDGTLMVVPFQVLYSIRRQLLLVHDRCQLLIIDPLHSKIVLRTDEFTDITHVAVVDEWIYLLTGENRVFQVRVEIQGDEDPFPTPGMVDEPCLESRKQKQGVYILDSMLNNNNNNGKQLNGKESPLLLSTEATIKEALVSVVRGKYGRNIKQMFMGYEQQQQRTPNGAPERPKTLNLTKIYEPSRSNAFANGNGHALLAEFGIEAEVEDLECDDMMEELVQTRTGQALLGTAMPNGVGTGKQQPGKKKFSTSLLDGYETSEDDATVRNLYLIFRSSIISNLNFADRYAKIFDEYDTETIVRLLRKLETLMEENEEPNARLKCMRIYFHYLKPELLWEIDADSRQFIKDGFIVCNTTDGADRACLERLAHCAACGYYLEATASCHYREIGTSLLQYYWSRKEYDECFAMVKRVPYLWRTITRYYIQDRREDKVVQCVWNLADPELLERAAGELPFELDHWRQLFELAIAYHQRHEMICLSCDKPTGGRPEDNQRDNRSAAKAHGGGDHRAAGSTEAESQFRQWNYLLGVALAHIRSPTELLCLVRRYADNIPRGAIAPSFYIRCLLLEAK